VVSLGEIVSRPNTVFVEAALLEEAAVPVGIENDDDPWGEVDSHKWEIRKLPDGVLALQLSEPVLIVDRKPTATDTESTDLLLMMMVDACCSPGFEEEPTARSWYADIPPAKEIPPQVRHRRLVARRST